MKQAKVFIPTVLLWIMMFFSFYQLAATILNGTALIEVFGLIVAGVEMTFDLRFDALTTLVFMMVTVLGVGIAHYGFRYLNGDRRIYYFYRYLTGLVISVSLFVLSDNLLMFFLMWLLINYNLHRLLLFYPERKKAIEALRKKQFVSLIGNTCLLVAITLTYLYFGTFNLSDIMQQMSGLDPDMETYIHFSAIAIFLVIGAQVKSAQFPFHFWLPETMETPAVVSALMHAGVINAGGFLLIRFSPILQYSSAAHVLLIIGGTVTGVYGALVMATQNNIKKKLAYSTVSQMGLMLLLIGFGAYGLALFHLIAHSFYKAYAFLTTGALIEESKKAGVQWKASSDLMTAFACLLGIVLMVLGMQYKQGAYFGISAYIAILLLSIFQNSLHLSHVSFSQKFRAIFKVFITLLIAVWVYSILEKSVMLFLGDLIPSIEETSVLTLSHAPVIFFGYFIFILGFWISNKLRDPQSIKMKKIYIFLWNDAYLGVKSSNLISKFFPSDSTARTGQ